ncbi:MAG TPA: hypothetical protein VFM30_00960 [Steroidobacteraceae bacterium]|nr:hypothetical protein [Steroidobacteraceae bacterium]
MTGDARQFGARVVKAAGIDIAIGYGLFLVMALTVSLVSAGGFMDARLTLADLLSGDVAGAALGEGSARGVLLVLLASGTLLVPALWRHRLAPLAFAVPLLATALALRPLWEQQRAQAEALAALGEFGLEAGRMIEAMGAPTGPLDALGLGAWLLFALVMYLALRGIARAVSPRLGATSSSAS